MIRAALSPSGKVLNFFTQQGNIMSGAFILHSTAELPRTEVRRNQIFLKVTPPTRKFLDTKSAVETCQRVDALQGNRDCKASFSLDPLASFLLSMKWKGAIQ